MEPTTATGNNSSRELSRVSNALLAAIEPETAGDLAALYQRFGPLLKPVQVADLLNVKPRLLEHWRSLSSGPPYLKLGDAPNAPVRYPGLHLIQWLEDRLSSGR